MAKKLRILIVEDVDTDYALLESELRKAGIAFVSKRVQTKESFLNELKEFIPDLIISDYALPHFDGMTALILTKEHSPLIPFIIITGSMNEETAVECMKAGADDYVIKAHIVRIGPAVQGALERKRREREAVQAEEALRLSEHKFRMLLEQASDGIFVADQNGNYQEANSKACEMLGYTGEELLRLNVRDILFPDDLQLRPLRFDDLRKGKTILTERSLKRKDGSPVPVEISSKMLPDGRLQAIARDITERKQAEQKINLLAHTMQSVGECVSITDMDDIISFVNGAFLKTYGFSEGELIGKPIGIVRSPNNPPELTRKILPATMRGGWQGELLNKKKDGMEFPVSLSTSVVQDEQGKPIALVGVATDITERVESRNLVDKLSSALEQTADAVIVTDRKGVVEYVNPAFEQTTGYSKLEVVGKTPRILKSEVHPASFYERMWNRILEGEVFRGIFVNRKKNGDIFFEEKTISPLKDKNGDITHFVSAGRDITESKKAEEELRASEEKYRSLFEDLRDVVYESTPDGKLLSINPAGIALFGYASKEEALAVNISRDIYVNAAERENLQKVLSKEGSVKDFELLLKAKDGREINVLLTANAVRDDKEAMKVIRGIFRDITERKKFEEQMRQVQKMESVGTLAGGIAHDFNNILGIIMAYASLLQRGGIKPEEMSSSINTILDAVQRGSSLVRQILTFARKSDVILEDVRVNDVVKELHKMLKETFPKTIEIRCDLDPSISPIAMDSGQLHQALLNLCVNARDAILDAIKQRPGGGVITITTRLAAAEELPGQISGATSGSYAAVTVSDTGTGMSEETKQRIFEPFFTTKELGKGTGLGLAVAYGIVKSHQGFIDVKSEIGRGTDFVLYFPTKGNGVKGKSSLVKDLRETPGGSETILLVEDEMALMELLKNLFQNKGYTVLTATNGLEAVEVFTRHKDTIHLVLSDYGLPKLSGSEAYKKMKQMNPRIRVVLASGFIEPNQKSEILKSGIKEFVQKPYDPQEVLRKVREVLDLKA